MMTTRGFRRTLVLAIVALGLAQALPARAQDWSRFRGPNGSGLSGTAGLPTEFGPATNVVWKTTLPVGYSSPILAGNRIFVTALRDETLLTICLDRRDGRVLWEREAPRPRREKLDPRNHPAAPSVATDGERAVAFFADFGMLAYDLDGKELWRLPLGPFNNIYGMGASPVIVGDMAVLVVDQSTHSYILAVDKRTGREIWRTDRPEAKSGHSTPIVHQPKEGPLQILVPGSFQLTSFAADTGRKLWWVRGLSFEIKSVPVIEGDTLYINGFGAPDNQPGRQVPAPPFEEMLAARDADKDGRLSKAEMPDQRTQSYVEVIDLDQSGLVDAEEWNYFRALSASENGMLAIRLGGDGDVTATNVRWRYHRSVPQLPSPLLYQGVLYMVNDGGIVTSLDPATGETLKQGRLKGAIDRYYASPVAADGKIYMVSEKGLVAVLPPDGSLEPIVVNDLGENCYATPALADGRIYVRTVNTLYAFGTGK